MKSVINFFISEHLLCMFNKMTHLEDIVKKVENELLEQKTKVTLITSELDKVRLKYKKF